MNAMQMNSVSTVPKSITKNARPTISSPINAACIPSIKPRSNKSNLIPRPFPRNSFSSIHKLRPSILSHICSAAVASFADSASVSAQGPDGTPTAFPSTSGLYAVYDKEGTLQYVGVSRKINISIATHLDALPELVASVKVFEIPDAGKEELTDAWKQWIQEAVSETGDIPPGNAPGEKKWQQRRPRAAKAEIRLTPGKGIDDLTVPLSTIIDQVVKTNKVVAFVKGTRTEPACGFSYKVLTMLTEMVGTDFEVVNVLDEVYNPGLRDEIKQYTQWPTIPQVFVGGEFVGGADIVTAMYDSGELKSLLGK